MRLITRFVHRCVRTQRGALLLHVATAASFLRCHTFCYTGVYIMLCAVAVCRSRRTTPLRFAIQGVYTGAVYTKHNAYLGALEFFLALNKRHARYNFIFLFIF